MKGELWIDLRCRRSMGFYGVHTGVPGDGAQREVWARRGLRSPCTPRLSNLRDGDGTAAGAGCVKPGLVAARLVNQERNWSKPADMKTRWPLRQRLSRGGGVKWRVRVTWTTASRRGR